jgi:hypothetical protein
LLKRLEWVWHHHEAQTEWIAEVVATLKVPAADYAVPDPLPGDPQRHLRPIAMAQAAADHLLEPHSTG